MRNPLAEPPSGLWNVVLFIVPLAVGLVMALALKIIALWR